MVLILSGSHYTPYSLWSPFCLVFIILPNLSCRNFTPYSPLSQFYSPFFLVVIPLPIPSDRHITLYSFFWPFTPYYLSSPCYLYSILSHFYSLFHLATYSIGQHSTLSPLYFIVSRILILLAFLFCLHSAPSSLVPVLLPFLSGVHSTIYSLRSLFSSHFSLVSILPLDVSSLF